MALVNPNNKMRTTAIAVLVLVMVSACTLPSCHAAHKYNLAASPPGGTRYCSFLIGGQACSYSACNDMCSRMARGQQHFTFCTRPGQCCCWFT
ncbi:hypothetical protein CFC21_094851 [Triticum aestivum]|uniref:Knottin scorpion toxin-like domain-containing protein n=2 Tax=Triticum aestivum TaxID=4565 RepID=A0A9R1LNZ9_WHEAT|nr:hypothetical protein CFC21_094851 [Triticum aestivum]